MVSFSSMLYSGMAKKKKKYLILGEKTINNYLFLRTQQNGITEIQRTLKMTMGLIEGENPTVNNLIKKIYSLKNVFTNFRDHIV